MSVTKITGTGLGLPTADGNALGGASNEWSDFYLADGGVIYFGNNQDVTVTHNADVGLKIKHTGTGDNSPVQFTLQTGETNIESNDVLGAIEFQAPDEAAGSDAILVAGAIKLKAEDDFTATVNTTTMEFHTSASEVASSKMTLSSTGTLEISKRFIAGGDTSTGDKAAMGYTAAEGLILTGQGSTNDVTIKNDADADVITIATGGTAVDVVGALTAATVTSDAGVAGTTGTFSSDVTGLTINATGDTAASDNAAIGYTAAEGLILTGQGSTNDVTIKNDADADVLTIATGTTGVTLATPLAVASGGMGAGTHSANGVLLGAGTGAVTTAAPSTSGNVLTSNGTVWASSAPAAAGVALGATPASVQVFDTSGSHTWTKPTGILKIVVTVVGAGGGGAGGAANVAGSAGATSSFGSHCSATAGNGGAVASLGTYSGAGASGGLGSGGNVLNVYGGGAPQLRAAHVAVLDGYPIGGATTLSNNSGSNVNHKYGVGGTGQNGSGGSGGDDNTGAPGVCVVWEYK